MGNQLKQIQFSDCGWVQDLGSSRLQRTDISKLQTLLLLPQEGFGSEQGWNTNC